MAAVEDNQPPHEKEDEERETEDNTRTPISTTTSTTTAAAASGNGVLSSSMSRKEKRKALKKMKRKQLRREIAIKEKQEEEARLNDPEEQLKVLKLEQEEAERMAKDRAEYEEREREFLMALEVKKKLMEEEDEERRKLLEEDSRNQLVNNDSNEDDEWDYIEEGPAEIIWKGNEIIVKKKKIRVPKKAPDIEKEKQESERPISNPLAPQSEAYEDYRSAQEVLESVAQQVPNFGTEQDKAHCPFHLKTGVCRFGARCSRVHFYPDKACTILIKNMYNGPGLAWEQDEGLEEVESFDIDLLHKGEKDNFLIGNTSNKNLWHTDEEVQRSFEDFYEDVHTEFLKFGEIVNFKVCKNGSSHLRGNVYVHYKSLESAMLAYQSINGRYFAGKLLTCEFVSLTRWRVAICGEYMKSRLKTCSRGSACNFLHCFCNLGGDYEWADWDKPAPRYWLKKMAALFGYTGDGYTDELSPGCHSRRSRSRELDRPHRKIFSDEDIGHKRNHFRRHRSEGKKTYRDYHSVKHRETFHDVVSDESTDGHGLKRKKRREPESMRPDSKSRFVESIDAKDESVERRASDRYMTYRSRSSSRRKRLADSVHDYHNVQNLDQGDSPYADKHHDTTLRHKGEHYSEKRKEVDSSIDDSYGDSPDSDENGHHRHSRKYLRKIKNEVEKSSSAFDESKHVRVDKRENRKERSRLKNKENASKIKCNGNSEDIYGTKKHRRVEKNSRGMKHTSGSVDGGDRLGKDERRRQKNESKRLKSHSDFTDTESDLDEHTHQRHSKKHSRNLKNDAESSDSTLDEDNLKNYEKRHHKSRSSHSKKKPEMGSDEDERHHGHRRSANNPYLSKDDTVERDGEASAAEKVETCVAHSSCQDSGEAEVDLEKACRHAALMKLEEIRKNKDIQAAHSKDSIESPKMCVHETNVSTDVILEKPGSIKSETSVSSMKRKRI